MREQLKLRPTLTRQIELSPILRAGPEGDVWQFWQKSGRWRRLRIRADCWERGTLAVTPFVLLKYDDGRSERVAVGEMILEAWGHPKPPGAVLCFMDGNPRNVAVHNLYWGDPPKRRSLAQYEEDLVEEERRKLAALYVKLVNAGLYTTEQVGAMIEARLVEYRAQLRGVLGRF